MKILPGSVAITALLSVILSVFFMNWLINDDPFSFFVNPITLEGNADGIRRIDVEVVDRKIFLEVHLTAPQNCQAVIKSLGIGTFTLKNKTFEPICSEVSKTLIKIVYVEALQS